MRINSDIALEKSQAIPGRISLLELLHPDSIANRSLVIGGNCPSILLPTSRMEARGRADLVILAPTVAECRTRGWLKEAVQLLAQELEIDGVAYVLAPSRWRLRIRRLLHNYGLSIDAPIVHLPNQTSSRYLVPLSLMPARYAFSQLIPMRSWKRCLAMLGFYFPGAERFLGSLLSSVGLIARHPGALPLFDWIFQLDCKVQRPGSVIISTSWRGQDGAVVLYSFDSYDTRPLAVAKINLTTAMAGDRVGEAAILARLGPNARRAGARVPQPLLGEKIGGHPVLLQTAINGQLVASLLASRPNRLLDLMERVACWLESWNHSTMVIKPLESEHLHRELLTPLALLMPLLQQGEEYRDWLMRRCATAIGTLVPLVATHNDLTMSNVLLDEQGRLGIVDWETGREEALPFVDFFYAMVDAVAATQGYTDRLQAFEACFAPGGTFVGTVTRLQMRLRHALEMPAHVADLCFHACWLHHAANEHRLGDPSNRWGFLKIVQWLALHRSGSIDG